MTTTEWQSAGDYFNYKGHRIFYRKGGSGPTLLLIHGFPTASWDWHLVFDRLCAGFTVYALDMIGFGFSDKPKSYGYSLTDQADLHEVFAEKTGITTAHILAHDYGDTVAQEMLARYIMRRGQSVRGLNLASVTLLNGGILQGGYQPRFIQKFLASPAGPWFYPFIGKGSLRRTFRNIFGSNKPTEREIDEFWSLITYNNGRRVIPSVIRYLHERKRKRKRWESALRDSPVPLLLINGIEDPISGQNIVDKYRETVNNPRIVTLPGVGHYPQTEAPSAVLSAFLTFVTEI